MICDLAGLLVAGSESSGVHGRFCVSLVVETEVSTVCPVEVVVTVCDRGPIGA